MVPRKKSFHDTTLFYTYFCFSVAFFLRSSASALQASLAGTDPRRGNWREAWKERERERREAAQNEAQGREQSAPNKEGLGEESRRHPPRLTNLKAQVGGGGWGKRVQKAMDTKVSREPRGPLRIQVGGEEGTFEHN